MRLPPCVKDYLLKSQSHSPSFPVPITEQGTSHCCPSLGTPSAGNVPGTLQGQEMGRTQCYGWHRALHEALRVFQVSLGSQHSTKAVSLVKQSNMHRAPTIACTSAE